MGKRANGEGSIYRQKNGLWAAAVTVGYDGETGALVRKYVYGKTKQEVQEKKMVLLEAVKAGVVYVDSDKITVGQWLEKWLSVYAKTGVRGNTFAGYRAMVKNHLVPRLGAIRLQKLKGIDIQSMINDITAAGGSARLAEAAYNVLRIALNKAIEQEIIFKPVYKGVALPQKLKKEYTPLTREQWNRLFAAAQKKSAVYPAMPAALSLLWATGVSRSELLALKWSDVNWQTGTISILRADIITDDGPEINNTKAAVRRRVLPLPKNTLDDLKKYKSRQTADRLAAKEWMDHDLIFAAEAGQLQDPRNWSKKFAKVAEEAGIAVTPHKLRHDHASRLAENGASIKDAQYRLGHSTSRMLLDVYTHRMTGGQESIAAWLNDSFPQVAEAGDEEAQT